MSTTSAPRGLKPIGILGGMPFAGSTREYLIKSGYSTAIFNGDVVGFANVASSTDDGHLVRETAAGEVNPIGVFLGVSYTDLILHNLLLSNIIRAVFLLLILKL